tara:strand:+ start:919 stop:1407 length:489 start_codon:yes stop_codon:yes gene_type:complete
MAKDFHLKFPQWSAGNWIVGLGSYLFNNNSTVHIYCDYRKKTGSKLWDSYLVCTKAFAEKHPLVPLKSNPNVKLYRIPFGELQTFHEEYMDKEELLAKEQVKPEQEVNKKLLNKRELEYYILKQQNQSENNQSALEVAIDVFCENKKVKVYQISKTEYELEY